MRCHLSVDSTRCQKFLSGVTRGRVRFNDHTAKIQGVTVSNRLSFRVCAAFVMLGCISATSQGETSLETKPVVSHSAVVAVAPVIPPPVVVESPASVSSITAAPTISLNPVSSVVIASPVVTSVAAKLPTIAPPKASKKVKRPVVRHAIRPLRVKSVVAQYNQPYIELGVKYVPIQNAMNYFQRGEATWYSNSHQGQATVNGEIYDIYGMTAAHPTLPIPSYARVTNLGNRKSVVVRINDRGPFGYHNKIIDLSYAAANKIGLVGSGERRVEILSLVQDMLSVPLHTSPANPVKITFKSTPKATTRPHPPLKSAMIANLTGETYLQLGAFKTVASAQVFKDKVQRQLGAKQHPLAILVQENLHRVRIGPYPNREEAQRAASEMTLILGFKPLLK
jgi:rare lipoprotein A